MVQLTALARETRRKIHFDAYSAWHVPAAFDLTAPHTLSFVNTFPLIMNAVFGENLDLHDHQLIELPGQGPFEQNDVTESFARWYD